MIRKLSSIVMFACAAICLTGHKAAGQSSDARQANPDFAFETGDFMKQHFYPRPEHMAVFGKDLALSGAWGKVNAAFDSLKTGNWYIEEQRYAGDAIAAGISGQNTAVIDRALTAYRWGFSLMASDGSFACPDHFHSASFFIEAVAHSCLLLQSSNYAGRYGVQIAQFKPLLQKAARWMITEPNFSEGIKHNKPYTHRRYLVAAALGETAVLCNDPDLLAVSKTLIQDGLSLQSPAGFNPEKGGYDCSYHSVGLNYARRYHDWVADKALQAKIRGMYGKAVAWLQTRIDPNGVVNPEGNTRTGLGQEKGRGGNIKTLNYGSIAQALEWWAVNEQDTALQTLAGEVAENRHKVK